jgi:hypothetical protein
MQEREKQIEEMARSLNEATFGVNVHTLADHLHPETINKVAEYLYNAGYHKQSEVVRCKDCKHFYQDGNIKICRHWNCHSTEDNAYCSYAKMKGGAENG